MHLPACYLACYFNKKECANLATKLRKTKMASNKRMLTDTEVKILLEGLQGKSRVIVLISIFTGMNLKDTLSLKWNDIDLENANMIYRDPETNRKVVISLAGPLVDVLSRYKKEYITGAALFYAGEMSHDVQLKYRNHFKCLFQDLGIMNFDFHQLKHSRAVLITNFSSNYHAPVLCKNRMLCLF